MGAFKRLTVSHHEKRCKFPTLQTTCATWGQTVLRLYGLEKISRLFLCRLHSNRSCSGNARKLVGHFSDWDRSCLHRGGGLHNQRPLWSIRVQPNGRLSQVLGSSRRLFRISGDCEHVDRCNFLICQVIKGKKTATRRRRTKKQSLSLNLFILRP